MNEQDKNSQELKHNKELFKEEVGYTVDTICLKYSLSGSQNFIVIGFWNQRLPNTSRVSLAST